MDDKKFYSFKRNENEEVRIALREYKGKEYVDIRIFFKSEDGKGQLIPSKKGVTVSKEQHNDLRKGLKEIADMIDVKVLV
jgi:hypothetical protein